MHYKYIKKLSVLFFFMDIILNIHNEDDVTMFLSNSISVGLTSHYSNQCHEQLA